MYKKKTLRHAMPGEVSPAPGPLYDLDRLAVLRDRHADLMERYRRAGAAVQEASKGLARLRSDAGTHPAAVDELRKPGAELQKLTVEHLTMLQISPRTVQQILTAETRLARLVETRDDLKQDVNASIKFAEQLEIFAKAKGLI